MTEKFGKYLFSIIDESQDLISTIHDKIETLFTFGSLFPRVDFEIEKYLPFTVGKESKYLQNCLKDGLIYKRKSV